MPTDRFGEQLPTQRVPEQNQGREQEICGEPTRRRMRECVSDRLEAKPPAQPAEPEQRDEDGHPREGAACDSPVANRCVHREIPSSLESAATAGNASLIDTNCRSC